MGSVFGSKALDGFLSAVGSRVLVRSHEPVSDGARVQLGGKVLTVYSTRCGGLPVEKIAYAEIDLSKPLQNAGEIEVCRL